VGRYVQLGDVRTWFDVYGSGPPVIMLHGGGSDARPLAGNAATISSSLRVYTPDRRGHGRTADVDGPLTYQVMAGDTAAFVEQVVDEPAHLVGVSDGGIVALLVGLRHPDLVRHLALVASVFHRDGWLPGAADLDDQAASFFRSAYAEVSPDGPDHFDVVTAKLATMHAEEPTLTADDLGQLNRRTLVMVGDDDEVRLEHAIDMYRAIPDGELAVVPGTSHGLLVEKPDLCNRLIVDFLTTEPVQTLAPIRRQAHNGA
jgi:pimeloyl-ACP methyl ester carboxylesterase